MTEKEFYNEKHDTEREVANQYLFRPEWANAYEIHELTEAVKELNETVKDGVFQITTCLKYLR